LYCSASYVSRQKDKSRLNENCKILRGMLKSVIISNQICDLLLAFPKCIELCSVVLSEQRMIYNNDVHTYVIRNNESNFFAWSIRFLWNVANTKNIFANNVVRGWIKWLFCSTDFENWIGRVQPVWNSLVFESFMALSWYYQS